MIISSQRYLNDEIISEKIAAEDFEILVSPAFEIDGMTVQVLLDGHHSLAAAKSAGVEPIVVEADAQDHDAVSFIAAGQFEDFMASTHMGDDYYNTSTGRDVW